MFCAVSLRKVYWLFFFEDNTISGQTYFEMPQQWLFPESMKTLKVSSFNKMEHHRIDIAIFEVF